MKKWTDIDPIEKPTKYTQPIKMKITSGRIFIKKRIEHLIASQYNYLFYLTVRILNWCSNKIIIPTTHITVEVASDFRTIGWKELKKGENIYPINSYSKTTNCSIRI